MREPALPYVGPAGGVSGGLEAARSKGVLGFDGIKNDRMADKLYAFISPMQMQCPCRSTDWRGLTRSKTSKQLKDP